nr:MAG TPA: hypothetical protein [Caudoviricetes sp.]
MMPAYLKRRMLVPEAHEREGQALFVRSSIFI